MARDPLRVAERGRAANRPSEKRRREESPGDTSRTDKKRKPNNTDSGNNNTSKMNTDVNPTTAFTETNQTSKNNDGSTAANSIFKNRQDE
ncbi:hypothetical protein COOONC_06692 [Cooperia oncophora]